jgi:hypothetical protein
MEKSLQKDASVSLERITVFSGVSPSSVDTGTHNKEMSKMIVRESIALILFNSFLALVDFEGFIIFSSVMSFIKYSIQHRSIFLKILKISSPGSGAAFFHTSWKPGKLE